MKAVCIAGWSDSGKTTLIERLIPLLMGRGLRVGVVKHTHHSLSMDQHGSDTDRYRGSGAAAVVLARSGRNSPARFAPHESGADARADARYGFDSGRRV